MGEGRRRSERRVDGAHNATPMSQSQACLCCLSHHLPAKPGHVFACRLRVRHVPSQTNSHAKNIIKSTHTEVLQQVMCVGGEEEGGVVGLGVVGVGVVPAAAGAAPACPGV